jgi:precorrin-6A/cobalt-precorrin-6A reductase
VVATHPFAAQMRGHAAAAARLRPTPLLIVDRPAWTPQAGDRWIGVPDMAAAAEALGAAPRRVLLTIGRQDLAAFIAAGHHAYLVRSIDPPDRLPADAELILARGPFSVAEEQRLMVDRKIEVLVTKNAGGAATEAKLVAARALGVPMVIVRRPLPPDLAGLDAKVVADAQAAVTWLEHQASTERGV